MFLKVSYRKKKISSEGTSKPLLTHSLQEEHYYDQLEKFARAEYNADLIDNYSLQSKIVTYLQ